MWQMAAVGWLRVNLRMRSSERIFGRRVSFGVVVGLLQKVWPAWEWSGAVVIAEVFAFRYACL